MRFKVALVLSLASSTVLAAPAAWAAPRSAEGSAQPPAEEGPARSKRADPNENEGPARSKRADPNENEGPARSKRADPNKNDAPADAPHGPDSAAFPSHRFQLTPRDLRRVQVAVNFGVSQILSGGFNVAGEVRYRRLWLEYSHGIDLTLNNLGGAALSSTEQRQGVHIFLPYTTGFGVGATLLDEMWLGVEFKTHRYEVNAPGGATVGYQTYTVGPVLGYKFFAWRGLHANLYLRYWPTVATSLDEGRVELQGKNGTVTHDAHALDFFANVSLGYAFNL
jgi:hypothetical protein